MFRALAPLLLALAPSLAVAADSIRVYNWNDYIAPQVLADFTKATGIEVDYHTYSTAEELETVLASGEKIDIAVPSHDTLLRLIKDGRLQPLDFARLPNRSHLDKQLLSKLAAVDPSNRHAVPYLWGAVGLAINTPKAEAAYGGPLPDSWSVLFNPAQSAKLASCGISVLDAPDEVLSTLMNYQGNNFARSSAGRMRRAGKVLETLRPHLAYVDSERYIEDLNTGKLCLALAWAGDALAAAQAGQPVKFIVPREGSVLFIDNLVIPSSASRADLAHTFINFMLQPQVAALITSETLYPNGNADATQYLDAALREDKGLYPDRDTKRRLFALDSLPEQLIGTRNAVWEAFRDGKQAP